MQQKKKNPIPSGLRVLTLVGIITWMAWSGWQYLSKPQAQNSTYDIPKSMGTTHNNNNNPISIHNNNYFSLGYSEDDEQALWVSYTMTRAQLNKPRLARLKNFSTDRHILTGSATDYDYRGSGYTRGHLAPSADMSFDSIALAASYRFSNISPQLAKFNGGIWRELEEQTRDWARASKRLHIVTGPIFTRRTKTIGKNRVTVPTHFYKVLMDADLPEKKAIGFVIPHQVSYKHLNKYAVSVDQVEQMTGLDFFDGILPDDEEETLEQRMEISKWKFNNKRYKLRIEQWNKR